jgi:hypothetical protein
LLPAGAVAGWGLHPLESAAFSRRTPLADICSAAKSNDGTNPHRPDPKLEAQAEALVKKNGFASLAEYDDVTVNIAMIMSGIDQQTKKFTEPLDQIKKDIASIKANKSIPEAQKREDLAQLGAALNDAKPIQFKENIAMVLKYFDQLPPLKQEEGPAD